MLDLAEVKDYLFCSLLYYLKHRPSPLTDDIGERHKIPAATTLDLPGMALSQALGVYATGRYPEAFPALVALVWEAWFRQKGVGDDAIKAIRAYAGIRKGILAQFLTGQITGKDHKPYSEPRMSARYKSMMDASGLGRIASSIDEKALAKIGCVQGELGGVGPYSLADAYTDSLHMASGYTPPLRETIFGLRVATLVPLPNHETLSATADLVILEAGSATIEVHDFTPALVLARSWVGRRLEVIAALEMTAADPQKPFPKVERALYRHFMTARTIERRSVRPARLVFALEAARRGIEIGLFIPQFLSGDLSRCRTCPAQDICIPASGDLVEWFLPGETELSARVGKAVRQVGQVDLQTIQKFIPVLERGISPTDFLNALEAAEKSRKGA